MAKHTKKRGALTHIALDASKQKEFNQNVQRVKKNTKDEASHSGVVYISHLPWGFEETGLKEYFKQFGSIKRLRLSRSKKTGNARGFAYIQFAHDQVAKIVAETMNNYLMFGKLIKCRHLLKPHPHTFRHANRRFIKPMGTERAIEKHNSIKSKTTVEKGQKKMLGKLVKLHAKLASHGIQYTLEDPHFDEVKNKIKLSIEAKKKAWLKKMEKNKAKRLARSKQKSSDDDDDDDDSSDEENNTSEDNQSEIGSEGDGGDDIPAEKITKKTAVSVVSSKRSGKKNMSVTPMSTRLESNVNKSARKTPRRESLIPKEVDTPKGKMNVLIEDSSEDEIMFKTPPQSIRSSKLDDTLKSMKRTPLSRKKTPPKRKSDEKTPVSNSKKAKGTLNVDVPAKKTKGTPKGMKVGDGDRKDVTPKSNVQSNRTPSGKKTPALKSSPSGNRRKSLKK